jgi:predicted nucleic acid-binding protein
MPIEPGLADTNVLIYALDADAPQHAAARTLLEAAREGSTTLYVTPQILSEFYAVVTNARRVAKPRSSVEVLHAISDLLTFIHVLPVPANVVAGWMALLRRHPVTGADVFDLQIVATMQAHNVPRIYTFNTRDFDMIEGISVATP